MRADCILRQLYSRQLNEPFGPGERLKEAKAITVRCRRGVSAAAARRPVGRGRGLPPAPWPLRARVWRKAASRAEQVRHERQSDLAGLHDDGACPLLGRAPGDTVMRQ